MEVWILLVAALLFCGLTTFSLSKGDNAFALICAVFSLASIFVAVLHVVN